MKVGQDWASSSASEGEGGDESSPWWEVEGFRLISGS